MLGLVYFLFLEEAVQNKEGEEGKGGGRENEEEELFTAKLVSLERLEEKVDDPIHTSQKKQV